ncbi:MAG: polysaccharide deacetylase family protein [Hyphomicrobiales bacterium]
MSDFSPLTDALNRIGDENATAHFWMRDDDAVSDTPALRQLDEWAGNATTDILLAVVPAIADETLKEFLVETERLCPCVHGWAHKSHASADEKKMELGNHRPLKSVSAELKKGVGKMNDMFGDRARPVLVPPWNRISEEVIAALPGLGFQGLSAFGSEEEVHAPDELSIANSQLDLIDWRGTRTCRPHDELVRELAGHIESRAPAGLPVGILGHHLVHDDAAWAFLDKLSAVVAAHHAAIWLPARAVFG